MRPNSNSLVTKLKPRAFSFSSRATDKILSHILRAVYIIDTETLARWKKSIM